MCKIDLKIDYAAAWMKEGNGGVGGWVRSSFHSPLSAFPYRGEGKMWSTIKFKLMARNALLYIYKGTEREDPNFPSFLVPFSSFCKKRNR